MSGLSVVRCPQCDSIHMTEPAYCDCGNDRFDLVRISPRGEIVSHTTLHVTPPAFEDDVPYTVAIVDLEEGPHVSARIGDVDGSVEMGDEVVVERRGEVQHWVTELEVRRG